MYLFLLFYEVKLVIVMYNLYMELIVCVNAYKYSNLYSVEITAGYFFVSV